MKDGSVDDDIKSVDDDGNGTGLNAQSESLANFLPKILAKDLRRQDSDLHKTQGTSTAGSGLQGGMGGAHPAGGGSSRAWRGPTRTGGGA
jgi:hypothetical protein